MPGLAPNFILLAGDLALLLVDKLDEGVVLGVVDAVEALLGRLVLVSLLRDRAGDPEDKHEPDDQEQGHAAAEQEPKALLDDGFFIELHESPLVGVMRDGC